MELAVERFDQGMRSSCGNPVVTPSKYPEIYRYLQLYLFRVNYTRWELHFIRILHKITLTHGVILRNRREMSRRENLYYFYNYIYFHKLCSDHIFCTINHFILSYPILCFTPFHSMKEREGQRERILLANLNIYIYICISIHHLRFASCSNKFETTEPISM